MSTDLQNQIALLQQQIVEMQNALKAKKAKPEIEKSAKRYAKQNGHYFKLLTDKMPAELFEKVKGQVFELFADEDIDAALCKIQLGRAIKERAIVNNEYYFWTPNQETLMFGPVKAGINNAKPIELFVIEPQYIENLGPAFDGDKAGKINLEICIEMEKFKNKEAEQIELEKLQKKLAKLMSK
jgi:hypothetical protein